MALLAACEARALSVTGDHLVVEASGDAAALDTLLAELAPYGIEESARTSPIALHRTTPRGDGVTVDGVTV
jgi:acetolactate synthase small subunit